MSYEIQDYSRIPSKGGHKYVNFGTQEKTANHNVVGCADFKPKRFKLRLSLNSKEGG